jgi:hypothetical protein
LRERYLLILVCQAGVTDPSGDPCKPVAKGGSQRAAAREVGVETRVELQVGPEARVVRCIAAVHYIGFELSPAAVDAFAAGPVVVAVKHPNYDHSVALGPDSHEELLGDLRG